MRAKQAGYTAGAAVLPWIEGLLEVGWWMQGPHVRVLVGCGLLARGYGRELKPMGALGYRHAVAHLLDGVPLAATVEAVARDTRRYAKRQETWLSAEPGVVRLPPPDPLRAASGWVRNLLS